MPNIYVGCPGCGKECEVGVDLPFEEGSVGDPEDLSSDDGWGMIGGGKCKSCGCRFRVNLEPEIISR